MRNSSPRPQDIDAPPSPLLKNYYEFKGEHMTFEERADLFRGDSAWLRRVADLASLTRHPDSHSTPIDRRVDHTAANG